MLKNSPQVALNLQRARDLIDTHYDLPLDLGQLAHVANFSPYHLIGLFRRTYHETPHQYLTRKRIEKAKELLANSELPVTEICFAVGFESLGSFSALFRKVVGWAPSVYRARVIAQRQNPRKFIPHCYVIMYRLEIKSPPAA